ncbi:TlyA family RNA methyltransferase [Miniphocaeibacter halophilus]|uniref:TlyA family RNA methyltransferase n=1 Tax=Miniphocaeibacter halophilus TaxID=2931922 RepID=A0AC61MPQ8_9FIRM|nr:TlyA family RNA methyltransferase [Miniphocaeibacter halophilus]QQK07552.1 TlyA family RNA methyltransferase [Miniphocaeibacter halophilus]
MEEKRVDILLTELGYSKSRTYSKELIKQKRVYLNNKLVTKPSTLANKDNIKVIAGKDYVSRGAYKLIKALEIFNIEVNNKICLDIGSSTGGFTQVLLEYGAKKIYALDVGTSQLDKSIKDNPKVISLENTNIKNIDTDVFYKYNLEIITIDISFISIKKILFILEEIVHDFTNIIILIKPQFEGNSTLLKKGIVNKKFHYNILRDIIDYINKNGFIVMNLSFSPILGKEGNVEYLAHLVKGKQKKIFPKDIIVETIESAFDKRRRNEEIY